MSLVADLLSKVKPTGRKGDVPPNLKKVVAFLSDKRATKKKMLIYSVLSFLAIAGGIGAMLFVDLFSKPETSTKTSGISVAELKKRNQVRLPSQARLPSQTINQKQRKEEAKKEPEEVSKQQPKEDEKQKIDIEKQEEIIDVFEPDESEEIEAEETETREAAPFDKDLQLYLARSYEKKKDYSKAFESYKRILDVDPGNYLVMNNISSLLLHLEVFEKSIEYSERALNIKEDYLPSLINLGIAYIKSGNPIAGEDYLLKVISIEPSNRHALFNIAILYEKVEEYDKAYGMYQRLSKMEDYQGYLGLARIAEKQNRISDAIMFYRELMSIEAIDPRIKKMANDRIRILR